MNYPLFMRYMSFMLFTGSTAATICTIILWVLLGFTFFEGIMATAFFTSLSGIGLLSYFIPVDKKIEITEIGDFE